MECSFKGIVLLISIYFPPEPNGASTVAWNRAKAFLKIGYKVFILCAFPSYPSGNVSDPKYISRLIYIEKVEEFTLIRVRLLRIRHEGYLKRFVLFANFLVISIIYMLKIVKMVGKIDIVYSVSPILFSSFNGFVYSYHARAIFLYEAIDLWPEELVVFRTPLTPLLVFFGKLIANVSYSLPDLVITVSKLAAEKIRAGYSMNTPVYSVPVGVDLCRFPLLTKDNSRASLIDRGTIPSQLRDKFVLLYSGLISNAQGIENLVYAAEKLRREEQIVFLIVGEGEKAETILKLKTINDLDNVIILHYQPRDLMRYLISSADACVVMLSPEPIFEIAFPTKFYEYLACHKPIVCVGRGELAHLIESDNIGFAVSPGDTERLASIIKELQSSSSLVQQMEHNSSVSLRKFTLESISYQFAEILRKNQN